MICSWAGVTVRGIARELRRAALTISGEIARNGDLDGRYWPDHAKHAARARACQPRQRRIGLDGVLALTVAQLLAKRCSPEQVAHQLRRRFAGQRHGWLCAETIYQAIYDPLVALTRPCPSRASSPSAVRAPALWTALAMRMLNQRPAEVLDRGQAGHWQGDLIIGPGNRTAIRDAGAAPHPVCDPAHVP